MADSDIAVAVQAGIPVAILRAIRTIESGDNPRVVRFEPHLFLRRVPGADIPFTPDSERGVSLVASETNRQAFERARALNERAAIESTSWGLYQVLGGHLLRARPDDPVGSFDRDPRGVSNDLIVRWFRSRPAAQRAALAFDVPLLAELYNGSQRWAQRLQAALDAAGAAGASSVGAVTLGLVFLTFVAGGAFLAGRAIRGARVRSEQL